MSVQLNPFTGELEMKVAVALHTHTYHEEIAGTGTAFSLANTPVTNSEELYFNTLRLRKVSSGPGINEYTISGANITLGFGKGAGDYFVASYSTATATTSHSHVSNYELTGTGTSFSLPSTPSAGSERLTFNTLRLRRVAAAPGINEYTISGNAVTLGFTRVRPALPCRTSFVRPAIR
jgi:hypothetical protein